MTSAAPREHWSSRLAFLMALTGAAVGLGNLWRFPYIVGENGGGAFVLLYFAFTLVVGVPLVMAELALGRSGGRNPVAAIAQVSAETGRSRWWLAIGWFSILAPLLATTFYSVIAGWSLYYLFKSLSFSFAGMDAAGASQLFDGLLADPALMFGLHTLYLGGAVWIVGRGVRHGIESVSKVMMPVLFFVLLFLAIYAGMAGDWAAGWRFLFVPDFAALSKEAVLMALGQAMFSISVGTGAILTYGSYLSADVSIPRAAWSLALLNTLSALLAGLAIFPILLGAGIHPAEGPGLMFVALPIALGNMPGGAVLGILFFLLLYIAAFTSSLAMLEPFVSWITENRGVRRMHAAILTGGCVWLAGLSTVFSFNLLADFKPLDRVPLMEGRTMFSIVDFFVSNIGLPLNALLIALFAGWALQNRYMIERIGLVNPASQRLWTWATRLLAPAAVAAVFVSNL